MPLLQDIQAAEVRHRALSARLYRTSIISKFVLTGASIIAGAAAFGDLLGPRVLAGVALAPAVIQGFDGAFKWGQKASWHNHYRIGLEDLRHRLEQGEDPKDINAAVTALNQKMADALP